MKKNKKEDSLLLLTEVLKTAKACGLKMRGKNIKKLKVGS
jgi:cell division protein FtsL